MSPLLVEFVIMPYLIVILNNITDLHLSNLGTVVPESPCYVFYATRCQFYCRFDTDDMAFASTLI